MSRSIPHPFLATKSYLIQIEAFGVEGSGILCNEDAESNQSMLLTKLFPKIHARTVAWSQSLTTTLYRLWHTILSALRSTGRYACIRHFHSSSHIKKALNVVTGCPRGMVLLSLISLHDVLHVIWDVVYFKCSMLHRRNLYVTSNRDCYKMGEQPYWLCVNSFYLPSRLAREGDHLVQHTLLTVE